MRQPNNKKGPEGMAKVNKDVVKRLMSYIGHYKLRFAAVLICIVVNALAMVSCSLYLQTLIDQGNEKDCCPNPSRAGTVP